MFTSHGMDGRHGKDERFSCLRLASNHVLNRSTMRLQYNTISIKFGFNDIEQQSFHMWFSGTSVSVSEWLDVSELYEKIEFPIPNYNLDVDMNALYKL